MNNIEFSEKKCRKAKERVRKFEPAMKVWGKEFSPSRSIGKCTALFRILAPESYDDFFAKYIKYASEHLDKPIQDRGLTEEELVKCSERYKALTEEHCGEKFPIEDYLYDALCHIIVETFDGMSSERIALEYLMRLGINVEYASYLYDSEYGIDILAKCGSKILYGIQVKPESFFKSSRYDVRRDRALLVKKKDKALSDGIKTYYMVYKKDSDGKIVWIECEDGKFAWTFDALNEKYRCF
ncbi:MAG: hypothetical protein J6X18_16075 [Bacteroidales bacterium]|nr:hypothetical protein [Bacteroidales bacterium]